MARAPRVGCARNCGQEHGRSIPLADASAGEQRVGPLPPQEAQLVAGPDAVPTPAGWGVDALRLPPGNQNTNAQPGLGTRACGLYQALSIIPLQPEPLPRAFWAAVTLS